jgi:transaldolase
MIEIFYDGLQVEKWESDVSGFTTNTSVFASSVHRNYTTFYNSVSHIVKSKPMSLQIWEDSIEQINAIHRIDPRIFVKIPIVNTAGDYNNTLILHAVHNNIPINITCIYTIEQITHLRKLLEHSSAPEIISVFGGPISDTGIAPDSIVRHAVDSFANRPHSRILWAGCREVYTIKRAEELGCHIITVPDVIMEKLKIKNTLSELSKLRVETFQNDARKSGLLIE